MIGGSRRENEGEKTNGKGLGRTHIKRKSSLIKKKKNYDGRKGKAYYREVSVYVWRKKKNINVNLQQKNTRDFQNFR